MVSAYDEIQSSGCECGYLASDVRWIDGSECIMNRVHFISGECLNYKKISTATFVSLLIPRDTIAKVGLPIKEYFIWGDDKEYTLRISDALPCFFVPNSTVLHKMKSNVGSNICTDELDRIGRYFYAFRNDYATAKKRGLRELLVYYMGFYLNFCRVIFKSKNGKRERLNIMQSGKKAGKHFLPQIERV